jgi:hypothetical protein
MPRCPRCQGARQPSSQLRSSPRFVMHFGRRNQSSRRASLLDKNETGDSGGDSWRWSSWIPRDWCLWPNKPRRSFRTRRRSSVCSKHCAPSLLTRMVPRRKCSLPTDSDPSLPHPRRPHPARRCPRRPRQPSRPRSSVSALGPKSASLARYEITAGTISFSPFQDSADTTASNIDFPQNTTACSEVLRANFSRQRSSDRRLPARSTLH